jgi:signal transduction histidine kinase
MNSPGAFQVDSSSSMDGSAPTGEDVRAVIGDKSAEGFDGPEKCWSPHKIVLCPHHTRRAALDIEQLRSRILGTCDAKFRQLDGTVFIGEEARLECQRQVAGIVDDFLQSLVRGTMVIDERSVMEAAELGAKLLVNAISPAAFARSSAAIFDVASAAVLELISGDPDCNANPGSADGEVAQRLFIALRALHHSAAERFQLAADRYEEVVLQQATEVQASDRLRLARRIHDEVGNDLSLAIRYLDLHDAYQATDPGRAGDRVSAARHTLRRVLEAVRLPASALRLEPPVVNIGLALSSFLRAFEASDVVLGIRVDADEAKIPENIRNELFIIVREALKNAITHARAHQVRATVSIVAGSIEAKIEDDGVGIRASGDHPQPLGDGMTSMRERTELLGGRFSVSVGSLAGSRIEICIPLPEHLMTTDR